MIYWKRTENAVGSRESFGNSLASIYISSSRYQNGKTRPKVSRNSVSADREGRESELKFSIEAEFPLTTDSPISRCLLIRIQFVVTKIN